MATYYINADTGNDTTGDGSQGNPWLTINKAHSIASDGDTVILQDSVARYRHPTNTDFSKYLIMEGESVGGAVFTIDDLVEYNRNWRFYNAATFNKIDFAYSIPIRTYRSLIWLENSNVLFKFNNCRFYNLQITSTKPFFQLETSAFGNTIEYTSCLFYDNNYGYYGIVRDIGDSNTVIYNNCVFYLQDQVNPMGSLTYAQNITLKNNIFFSDQATDISVNGTLLGSNNCFYSNAAGGFNASLLGLSNKVTTDPLFIDLDARDFNLSPSSPCIDAGTLI